MSTSSLVCPLHAAALEAPDAPAISAPRGTLSFRELDRLVSGVAERFLERGLAGRRVGFLLDAGLAYVVLLLGAMRARAVACPISTRLPPESVKARSRQVSAAVLVTDRDAFVGAIHPDALMGHTPPEASHVPDFVPDDPITVVFTSGSTGHPEAALHSFGNHYFSALGSNANIPLRPGDRWLLSLPLYHVGGLGVLFRCLLAGATIAIPNPRDSFDKQVGQATHVSMVATQLHRYLELRTPARLKAILLGGSAIPDRLIVEAHRRGLPIHMSYGLTEMASQVSTTPPNAPLEILRTSGRVLPHREVRIDDSGEIFVRGATRFLGYVDGERIRRPFDDAGWFRTGDLGTLEPDGLLRVVGRKDNLFISGGENIQPEAIEKVLLQIAGVSEAVVVPVPDEEFGHRPVAFLRGDGRIPSESAIRLELEKRLPRFMIPVAFHPWPAGELQGSIKPSRDALRRRAEHFPRE